jgi:UDP-glucose 4-epimerase
MPRRVPDLSKIHALVGYAPRHDLDAILADVIDYFQRQ